MFRIFGLDPLEGPSSEKFWQHVHPEDHDRVRERVEREAHEKREYIDEYRIVLADGTVKDIQDIGHPVFDATGNLVEFVGSTVDVTEHKRAEEALRESEERFRTPVQFSFDVYWESDAQHRFVRQEYAEGLADAPAAGCEIGKTRWEVPYLEPEPEAWRKHRERLDAHVPFRDFELARPTQDGGRRYVSVSGLPVFDKAGRFAGYRGVGRDITARKQGEAALRESEEQWKAVFENNPAMYFMVDAGGAIISVNPFGAEQLGFTVDELIGLPVQNLFHPEDREAVEKNTAICFQRHGPTMSWEARKIRKNGEVLWVRELARVMLIKDRPVALIVCEDITERKRVTETLRETQTELAHANRVATMGQLTASIAHEVNQPIAATVINANAAQRWLNAQRPDLEEVRRALGRIVDNGSRAGQVIGRIRALIKKAPPRKEGVAVNDAILEVVALTHGEAIKNSVSVRTQLAEDLPTIEGDRVQLQQVILNLIVNAIEAMSGPNEGPRELLISAEKAEPDGVHVSVRDSGPGLAPAALDRLFEAFYTSKPNGLGLGLSICRSIIEAHGGRLWATANAPRGAVFQFTAPAHPHDHD